MQMLHIYGRDEGRRAHGNAASHLSVGGNCDAEMCRAQQCEWPFPKYLVLDLFLCVEVKKVSATERTSSRSNGEEKEERKKSHRSV